MRAMRSFTLATALAWCMSVTGDAAGLRPETLVGWNEYVRATEARIAGELAGGDRFLAQDFSPAPETDRRAPDGGSGRRRQGDDGGRRRAGRPRSARAWCTTGAGAVFIPGASVDSILARIANPRAEDADQEDVLASRVLERGPGSLRLFLRLQRSQIVTVVYNTEHAVRFGRDREGRGSSRSISTRVAEVAEPATPREWERPLGEDRGFLWRLNLYLALRAGHRRRPGGVRVHQPQPKRTCSRSGSRPTAHRFGGQGIDGTNAAGHARASSTRLGRRRGIMNREAFATEHRRVCRLREADADLDRRAPAAMAQLGSPLVPRPARDGRGRRRLRGRRNPHVGAAPRRRRAGCSTGSATASMARSRACGGSSGRAMATTSTTCSTSSARRSCSVASSGAATSRRWWRRWSWWPPTSR